MKTHFFVKIRKLGEDQGATVIENDLLSGLIFRSHRMQPSSVSVRSLPPGCAVYLFGFLKVEDQRSEDVPAVHVLNNGQVLRQLSLNQVSRLRVSAR